MKILIKKSIKILLIFFIIIFIFSCNKNNESLPSRKYKTENVIIVIVDGARYSETWGDTTHQYIPYLANEISKEGIINSQFFNNGPTYTLAGHTSLTTGNYQEINNSGLEHPLYPSIFQYWNNFIFFINKYTWLISSKDKLEILDNCSLSGWSQKYQPSTDCGINGLGSGYRDDSTTCLKAVEILSLYHPKIVLLSFRDPDYSAHTGNWKSYIQGIKNTDKLAYKIWGYLQNDFYYKNKTTFFLTNDHGRHLDSISDGFVSHGDNCYGCRHINFFAAGPDFKKGIEIQTKRELIDIPATIAELLQIKTFYVKGKVMYELFQ